jgi:hypothetical protein
MFFLFSFNGTYGMHNAYGHGLHLCMRHHLPCHPVSLTYQAKIALSLDVYADDCTQFVIKLNAIFAFVRELFCFLQTQKSVTKFSFSDM